MQVRVHPDPVLKQRATEVDVERDAELRPLIRSMAETMYQNQGIGLAAPQIGVLKRVIVFDIDERLSAICNPEIVESSDDRALDEEGCLSVPGISVPVERARTVVCVAETLDGQKVRIHAEDLLARVLQHEIDHLDGVLILDRLTPEERKAAIRAYNEAAEADQAE